MFRFPLFVIALLASTPGSAPPPPRRPHAALDQRALRLEPEVLRLSFKRTKDRRRHFENHTLPFTNTSPATLRPEEPLRCRRWASRVAMTASLRP